MSEPQHLRMEEMETEEKTSFFDEWDEVVRRSQTKSKRKGIPKKLKNKHV